MRGSVLLGLFFVSNSLKNHAAASSENDPDEDNPALSGPDLADGVKEMGRFHLPHDLHSLQAYKTSIPSTSCQTAILHNMFQPASLPT